MDLSRDMLAQIWRALGGDVFLAECVEIDGKGALPSAFAVSDFAVATTVSAALALAEWAGTAGSALPDVKVDRRLSSLWFAKSVRPQGWSLPPQWDPVAGNYQARDGWVRLHTNAPHHRRAALAVLSCMADARAVADCVADWDAEALEEAVVANGGCAAKMRSREEWATHEQGRAVVAEPLIAWKKASGSLLRHIGTSERPLHGLRVLDLTRVLAGPVATRFLAGFGADVLRIDPPDWDEPAVLPEVTIGKRRARLDLRVETDRELFRCLLTQADVLVHGYRADALERMGFGERVRTDLNPQLVDVALDAYGWSGPWAHRRGFDTIVQMSCGLAHAEMSRCGHMTPQQLPVQALDFGTGHMMAAAVLRALTEKRVSGRTSHARFSLARTAAFLAEYEQPPDGHVFHPEGRYDLSPLIEETCWGSALRLLAPFAVSGIQMKWDLPAGRLGDSAPAFGSGG